MVQACERCGTFAELTSNGFRALCEPCLRLDRPGSSVRHLITTLVALLVESWKPIVLVIVAKALVVEGVARASGHRSWVSLPVEVATDSALEALLLGVIAERVWAGRSAFRSAVARAKARYFAVLGVNVIGGAAVLVGTVLLCVPGVVLGTLLWSAVPIALFEDAGPIEASRLSWQRMRPVLWPIAALAFVSIASASLPGFLVGVNQGFLAALKITPSPGALEAIRMGSELLTAALTVPSMVFQLVTWRLTRPHTARPPDLIVP
jgi:hypothetical protein